MQLSQHDLQQLDEGILQGLPEATLRRLSVTLLADLKEARERLQQHPGNSSRPPSSRAPWERGCSGTDAAARAASAEADARLDGDDGTVSEEAAVGQAQASSAEAGADAVSADAQRTPKRKAGKQPGAPGFGRTQVFQAQREELHRPPCCVRCGQALPPEAPQKVYTGFQSIDVRWGDPGTAGLQLEVVDHRYLDVTCRCGHCTRAQPAQGEVEETLEGIALREWRLVGPGLASFIVALNLRFRLSRERIQEFLNDWLGVRLSIGTLHQTLHETGAVVAPAEVALIADLLAEAEAQGAGGAMHADETSWPQQDQRLWLWVFLTTTTTVYVIAGRGKATVKRLLAGFQGWLMSDGWFSYRDHPRRLRCWDSQAPNSSRMPTWPSRHRDADLPRTAAAIPNTPSSTKSSSSTWRPTSRWPVKMTGTDNAYRPTWSGNFAGIWNAASWPAVLLGRGVRTAGMTS